MKNIILVVFISLFGLSTFAQETDSVLRSKKGIPILPQAGDFAIGADALPYLNYLGNIFNNTSKNTLDLGAQTLYLRYFLTDKSAVRLLIGINKNSAVTRNFVRDDAAYFQDPLSRTQTEDKFITNISEYKLDLGYQIFRGYGRLRGFYGAHITYNTKHNITKYTYGNPMSATNPTPSINVGIDYNGGARVLESDNGYENTIGIGGIAGVEYYFAPKICVGGEITLNIYNSWRSEGNTKTEYWSGSRVVKMDTEKTPAGRTGTGIYTERPANFGGSLYLMFHF